MPHLKITMQDPHVVSLKYALLVPVGLVYENVPAVDLIRPQFAAQLCGGNLELKMSAHFPSISEARKPVDDFLKSWEMDAHLRGFQIAFSFVNGEVIDRNPAPPGTVFLSGASASCSSSSTVRGNITVFPREYPNPPEWKTCSDLVRRMYGRFVACQEKRESIGCNHSIGLLVAGSGLQNSNSTDSSCQIKSESVQISSDKRSPNRYHAWYFSDA